MRRFEEKFRKNQEGHSVKRNSTYVLLFQISDSLVIQNNLLKPLQEYQSIKNIISGKTQWAEQNNNLHQKIYKIDQIQVEAKVN